MTTYEFNNGMKVAWEPMTRENHKRFKERDRLEEIAMGMTRDNVQAYIKQYSAPRVVRVLAAAIKANPHDYSKRHGSRPAKSRRCAADGTRKSSLTIPRSTESILKKFL